ncbi:hypothetical protein HDC94_001040 [Leifsonia sp. AK011]|uniref:hypothetical protein n=1 Tax=Leifsonia sp. AK011 TaxID=2723075 RepID=UPI0015C837A1|nr:hypothetical protein [Leifsonia sp. AK011]NYF09884.1 hypothetical protein [Leifsonia sp. AK011]
MTAAEERELEALRERVYGPNGGLAPDEAAVRRLQQLEEARRPTVPRRVEVDMMERPPEVPEASAPEEIPRPWWESAARELLRRLDTVPRLMIPIILAVAALVTVIVVAVILVQRLQTEPLVGSTQEVARLALDPTYDAPLMFTGEGEVQVFESFHGLRAIAGGNGAAFASGTQQTCLLVFNDAEANNADEDFFSGFVLSGCGAGGFPAVAQFPAQVDGLPDELRAAFPESALQFVYDSSTSEVVVFESPR